MAARRRIAPVPTHITKVDLVACSRSATARPLPVTLASAPLTGTSDAQTAGDVVAGGRVALVLASVRLGVALIGSADSPVVGDHHHADAQEPPRYWIGAERDDRGLRR